MFDITDDYIEAVNNAYWVEEDEIKCGCHPTQVLERIKEKLYSNKKRFHKITFIDWNYDGTNVGVSIDGNFYGIFNYEENEFV